MSERQLQSATTFNVLIVAEADREAALIAEILGAASQLCARTQMALSADACASILAEDEFDAVVLSQTHEDGASSLAQWLAPLKKSGQNIPLILIADRLEGLEESLHLDIADCLLRDRLSLLPHILQHRLLPPDSALGSHLVRALQSAAPSREFIEQAARLLCQTLAVSRCAIIQPTAGEPLRMRSACDGIERAESFDALEETLARNSRAILQLGNLLIVRNSNLPLPSGPSVAGQVGKLLFVPLGCQQSALGVLGLLHQSEQHRWTEAELSWVKTVATYCAIALEREECARRLQQQQEWHRLLSRVAKALNSTLALEVRLQEAMACVGEYFGVDRALLLCIGESDISIECEWRARSEIPSTLNVRLPRSEWPELLDCDRANPLHQPFQTTDLVEFCRERESSHQTILQSESLSTLSVPIFVRDRLFGWLTLQTTAPSDAGYNPPSRTFTPEEVNILDSTASLVALAVAGLQQEDRLQREVEQRTQEIESANRAKSEFLSTMSHELRAPLTSVIGFARVLLERIYGELNGKQVQYITAIAESGEHLLALIEDLLDISKIEANKEELYLETLSVEEVCRSCFSLLQERAQQAGLQLNLALDDNVSVCWADRRRLKQILVNLLSNAIKFTPAGSVTLAVRVDATQLYFSVIDTGIGIAPADLQTLFQPFQQIQTPLHRKHKGSGLGLALSRKLARLHGGDLVARSVAGEGSCFTLSLPRQNEAGSEAASA